MSRRYRIDWTAVPGTREHDNALEAARHELAHGFRGPATDADMVRMCRLLTLVYGPAPEPNPDYEDAWLRGTCAS